MDLAVDESIEQNNNEFVCSAFPSICYACSDVIFSCSLPSSSLATTAQQLISISQPAVDGISHSAIEWQQFVSTSSSGRPFLPWMNKFSGNKIPEFLRMPWILLLFQQIVNDWESIRIPYSQRTPNGISRLMIHRFTKHHSHSNFQATIHPIILN